jgi:hypothetical protein
MARYIIPRAFARAIVLCTTASIGLCFTGSGAAALPPSYYVVHVGPGFSVQLGPWRVDRDPTYAAAIETYGDASACTLQSWFATAVWRSAGFRLRVTTLGVLPTGTTFCSAPDHAQIDTVTIGGKRWRTDTGLHIGDPVSAIRSRYPTATAHHSTWWLVTWHAACLGDCGQRHFVTAPVLTASVVSGHIAELHLIIGAQGE